MATHTHALTSKRRYQKKLNPKTSIAKLITSLRRTSFFCLYVNAFFVYVVLKFLQNILWLVDCLFIWIDFALTQYGGTFFPSFHSIGPSWYVVSWSFVWICIEICNRSFFPGCAVWVIFFLFFFFFYFFFFTSLSLVNTRFV